MKKTEQKQIRTFLLAVCVTGFLCASGMLYNHISYKNNIIRSAKNSILAETDRVMSEIDSVFDGVSSAVSEAAENYRSGKLDERGLEKKLEDILSADAHIRKIGVVFAPAGVEESAAGKPVIFERKGKKARQAQAADAAFYTEEKWYRRAVSSGANWDEPVLDEAAKNYSVTFSVPVYKAGADANVNAPGGIYGVIYAELSLKWLRDKMDSLKLEKKDYGTVLSKKGTILYHPLKDMVLSRSNIFDMLKTNKGDNNAYEKHIEIMKKAVNGETGSGFTSTRTGQMAWFLYKPIRSTGWPIVVRAIKDTVPINGEVSRRQRILIALSLIFFLTSLAALLFRLYEENTGKVRQLWWTSITFSLLCFVTACYTWHLALVVPLSEYQVNKDVIDDPVSLSRFTQEASRLSLASGGKKPVFIPTGIHIQSMEFATSNDIAVSGYVWQRYLKGTQDDVRRGFIMPEAKVMSGLSEVYRLDDGREEVVGWYFEAVLRHAFDYSKYPFDHPNISIRLLHGDFLRNVILVPDLKGYAITNAVALPGIQDRLALPGYSFTGTFFSCDPKMRNTNFGADSLGNSFRVPEYSYNVIIKRNFLTPLVSKLFPVFVVISMLFIVILSFSTDVEKQKNFGLSGLAIFALIVSFFFTTLLTQIDLRQQILSDKIMFIENFNFITYLVLLLSAVQAFLFASEKKWKFIKFEHCLIPKLLYWPVVAFLILAVSLMYFY